MTKVELTDFLEDVESIIHTQIEFVDRVRRGVIVRAGDIVEIKRELDAVLDRIGRIREKEDISLI